MSFYNGSDSFKKVGLLFFLLTPSMLVFADSSETSGVKPEDAGNLANQHPLMTNNFPRWSEHQRVETEIVPPPPPGPYMSLGLNDFPVSETPFSQNSGRPQVQMDSSGVPIQTFSPDVPWPKNIRPTRRWMPENGYQYINPQAEKNMYPAMQNEPANNYYYGYPGGSPYMASPGANWAPAMGAGPSAPYYYAPDYAHRYNNPANSNRSQPANPGYWPPYPPAGNQ